MALREQQKSGLSSNAAVLFQGGIGVLGLLAILFFGIPVWVLGPGLWASILYGVCGAVATYAVLLMLSRIPGLFPESLERQMQGLYDFASGYSPAVLVLLSLLAGIGEELLFRGALQGWLMANTDALTAVAAASVLFGLVHYVSFTYFLVATGLGLILGVVYLVSESLVLVMIWHAVYDLIALFCLLRFPHWFGVRVVDHRQNGRQE
ncbi:CPBP family intramembrane glutamic endopeptidase [Marinobacter sp. F3R08]|uniref:CPBP family intramembrane glutamic endopeptidase n=1 Tax=Marinobacter sp. F3R08 TaxID=2841559 RepID=UPI001C085042|nr:type II CAAX endopeptidase family protein [Marinobacter sp. F3R08]MBU2954207.1 CPBP family intramembrane metalloprotease [Marinobacter sp. F3R08]